MKRCRRCKKDKPIDKYRRTWIKSVGKFYFRSYCNNCLTQLNNERRMLNPRLHEKKKEKMRKRYHVRQKELKFTPPNLYEGRNNYK